MRIGILGSGLMGGKLGAIFARSRKKRQIAYEGRKGPEVAYRVDGFKERHPRAR
ncbi:MAG TPA: hypothetical protein VEG36_03840 [Burkholderiales bacterium]|nr:hypothetical protein [Burkholderiales bacterium]